jgi:hypothetical protein
VRIIIEPSAGGDQWDIPQHKVVIEHPSDECELNQVLELLGYALRAWGFSVGELTEVEDATVDRVG